MVFILSTRRDPREERSTQRSLSPASMTNSLPDIAFRGEKNADREEKARSAFFVCSSAAAAAATTVATEKKKIKLSVLDTYPSVTRLPQSCRASLIALSSWAGHLTSWLEWDAERAKRRLLAPLSRLGFSSEGSWCSVKPLDIAVGPGGASSGS